MIKLKTALLFQEDVSAKEYLSHLLISYPYDIEEAMVYSLLAKTTYPHPVLLSFISYFEAIQKYRICTKTCTLSAALLHLFDKMSALAQKNPSVLHIHHYAFDATFLIKNHTFSHPYAHLPFNKIPFIDEIHIHSTPLLQMPLCKQNVPILKQTSFIFRDISMDASSFYALSIQIADKKGIIFLSKDCLSLAICIASMYPLCSPSIQQDFILIFGLSGEKNKREYYFDETNELLIGLVSGDSSMHHFQYLKDMILTLYNSICLCKHDLPMHASMIELTLQQHKYGLVFAGESGTGKSEMLLAFMHLCKTKEIPYTPLYDDHGTLHYLDNEIVSTGGEVSSCKKINDMKKVDIFHDFTSSIFLQEKKGEELYQITPLITHKQTVEFHKVTHMFYLDTISKEKGFERIDTLQECQELFLKGPYRDAKRILCSSFFFNALGPHQQRAITTQLLNDFFTILYIQDIPIYALHTDGSNSQKETLFDQLAMLILNEILL